MNCSGVISSPWFMLAISFAKVTFHLYTYINTSVFLPHNTTRVARFPTESWKDAKDLSLHCSEAAIRTMREKTTPVWVREGSEMENKQLERFTKGWKTNNKVQAQAEGERKLRNQWGSPKEGKLKTRLWEKNPGRPGNDCEQEKRNEYRSMETEHHQRHAACAESLPSKLFLFNLTQRNGRSVLRSSGEWRSR